MSIKEGFKYLGGGVLVYGTVAACSAGLDEMERRGDMTSLGGGSSEMRDKDSEGRAGSTASPVPDANAQDDCGTCTFDGPIALEQPLEIAGPLDINGPIRVITADTDASRLIAARSTEEGPLVQGPFVVTSLANTSSDAFSVGVRETDCAGASLFSITLTGVVTTYREKIPVPEGYVLCLGPMDLGEQLTWHGFAPY